MLIKQKIQKNIPFFKEKLLKLSVMALAFFVFISPNIASARIFNPHSIITDAEMFDHTTLSKTAIQVFLEREGSALATYTTEYEGATKKASEIIWEVSQKYKVNPKFLLVTLEKEQALITKPQATQYMLDWATGYGCYGGTCRDKFKGFAAQLAATADTQNIYRDRAGQFGFQVGKTTMTVDNYPVTPANQATANLYIYTPHVGNAPELGVTQQFGANKLFWRLWHRYFSNQKFLDGMVVKTPEGYWLIEKGQKRKFASESIVFADYSSKEITNASSQLLSYYPEGAIVSFANNSLVKSAGSGQIFLIADNTKRPLLDNEALALLKGFNIASTEQTIPAVSDNLLNNYTVGNPISSASIFPQGKVFRADGSLWLIKDGIRYPLDTAVYQQKFSSDAPQSISNTELEKYPLGSPIKLKDGTFVVNNGQYYIISNGSRMRIVNDWTFDNVFGRDKKNNALSVSTALLNYHIAGDLIDYMDDTIKDPLVPINPTPTNPTPGVVSHNTSFESMDPSGLIMLGGQSHDITIRFKNTGSATWTKNDIKLNVYDQGKKTSLFNPPKNISFNETTVAPGEMATFDLSLTAPTTVTGAFGQMFRLSLNGVEFGGIGKFIIVNAAGATSEIVSHNIPVAVKNTWGPQQIEIKIKNTSEKTIWLSRRTALEIYNADGTPSVFYDQKDWVRREVAAVPINQTQIKPGEIGQFKFTINPKNLPKGNHTLNFQLKMLDKNGEKIYLNGLHQWSRLIRVD